VEDNRNMVTRTTYELTAEVWRAEGPSDRYFVTLPDAVTAEVRERFGGSHEAVGSLPISVALGQSIWSTSLYGDAASDSYVIPIKDDVRRRERVREAQIVTLKFAIKR
jgi:Domain of unknown function (DUF1905)